MVVSITVFDEAPTKVTLSTLLKSSVPWGVPIGISTIGRGYFLAKWDSSTLEEMETSDTSLGRSWPNGVLRIFSHRGEIAKGLAIRFPFIDFIL